MLWLWQEQLDTIVSITAALTSCGALWEQDIWWQLRLGDELLQGRGFPDQEEWTYTSQDKPFHNHWWVTGSHWSAKIKYQGQARFTDPGTARDL